MEEKREVGRGRSFVMGDDVHKLLALLPPLARELFRFLFLSGSRVQQAIRIKVGDVHLDGGAVTVNGKNGGSVSRIIVPPECVPFMAWRVKTATPQDSLFCSHNGSPHKVTMLRNEWRTACKALGLREVSMDSTRSSVVRVIADTAIDAGKLMGHTKYQVNPAMKKKKSK
jgi:integrase